MTDLQKMIDKTSDEILDRWAAEATGDVDSYIEDQLDILEETEPEVCMAVSKRHLARMFGAAK